MSDEQKPKESRGGNKYVKIDITGQRFGRLVAIKELGRTKSGAVLWELHCDCGRTTTSNVTSVKIGKKRSCGCLRVKYKKDYSEDLTGRKFGYLTVIKEIPKGEAAPDKSVNNNTRWWCQCDCGNFVAVQGGKLVHRNNTSCGCMAVKYKTNTKGDITGKKFGYLTAIKDIPRGEAAPDKSVSNHIRWWWQCDCGNFIAECAPVVINKHRTSCGCMYSVNSPEVTGRFVGRFDGTNVSVLKSQKLWKTNTSGVRGVSPIKAGKKWRWSAALGFQGKYYHLGMYDTVEEAAEARRRGEEKYYAPAIKAYEDMMKNSE